MSMKDFYVGQIHVFIYKRLSNFNMTFIFINSWYKSNSCIQFHSFSEISRVYYISWLTYMYMYIGSLSIYFLGFFFFLERCYQRNTTRCLGNGYSFSPTPWFFSQQSRSLFNCLFIYSMCIGHTVDVQNLMLSTCIKMVIVLF